MEGIRGTAGTGWKKGGPRAQRATEQGVEGRREAEGSKTHHRWSELEPAGNAMHTVTPCDTLQI